MRRLLLLAALASAAPVAAREPALPRGMTLDRVVVLMRHGVRPPTKAPAMPEGYAREAWPGWGVAPGYLTQRGAAAVRLVARHDRAAWRGAGLLPATGCARVAAIADSDQRTIATAQAYLAALTPGCAAAIDHRPQDEADPRFSAIETGAVAFDPAEGRRAVLAEAGPDGVAGWEKRLRPQLTRLDAILCGAPAAARCGVSREPTALAGGGKRPKLTGALDRGSTAAQVLLLEYADGKPMAEVGWGRAGAGDVEALSALHAAEFQLLARPRYVARANLSLLVPVIAGALTRADAAAVTLISGHDTNVASLGGLLGLHWRVPGLAADDPSPGGAIVLERLRDRAGRFFVRAVYRSQTVEQIRALSEGEPYAAVMPIAGCRAKGLRGLCDESAFVRALTR